MRTQPATRRQKRKANELNRTHHGSCSFIQSLTKKRERERKKKQHQQQRSTSKGNKLQRTTHIIDDDEIFCDSIIVMDPLVSCNEKEVHVCIW
jgi:hypothetical protein